MTLFVSQPFSGKYTIIIMTRTMNNMTHFARKAAASLLALFFSCAAMPAQETATPVEPVEPVEPAYPTLPIFSLRKGYATDVSLMKLVGASTSAIDR